ncbi:SH3 domain-containing protein [Yinghuangia seranimata]|uniref:SH3 domain-containing protein n=1 Tax=Yinghuangia seranimata TaxID=408067 RepID=UPI00248B3FB7|nr:SH3 domain-containing protein [Yinghuangia seranimata]MDI2130373.1 SH3 domain-containing protein [Yinghuangia seranimata]
MNAKRTAAVLTASGLLLAGLTVGAAGTAGAAPASAPAAAPSMLPASGLGMFGHVVNAPKGLNIRSKPNAGSKKLGSLANGYHVEIACKVKGQNIKGNKIWYAMESRTNGPAGWISARYVVNETNIPWCP